MATSKKHWVPVLAPALFKEEHLGDSYVLDTSTLQGRGITVNLMNVSGDMKKQHHNVSFRIVKVKDGKAHTRVTGIEMQSGSVKRLVRRGRSKLDDSFPITLKGQNARIKTLTITKHHASNAQIAALHHKLREVMSELATNLTFETLISDIVAMKLQRHLRASLGSVCPVRSVDIRVCSLLPKHALDEEQPVEESNYAAAPENDDGS